MEAVEANDECGCPLANSFSPPLFVGKTSLFADPGRLKLIWELWAELLAALTPIGTCAVPTDVAPLRGVSLPLVMEVAETSVGNIVVSVAGHPKCRALAVSVCVRILFADAVCPITLFPFLHVLPLLLVRVDRETLGLARRDVVFVNFAPKPPRVATPFAVHPGVAFIDTLA